MRRNGSPALSEQTIKRTFRVLLDLLLPDLDGFADIEQDALRYQGYQFCDRFVRRYVYPDLVARVLKKLRRDGLVAGGADHRGRSAGDLHRGQVGNRAGIDRSPRRGWSSGSC